MHSVQSTVTRARRGVVTTPWITCWRRARGDRHPGHHRTRAVPGRGEGYNHLELAPTEQRAIDDLAPH